MRIEPKKIIMRVRETPTRELALAIAKKHKAVHRNFDHYAGVVTMHGLARIATEADADVDSCRDIVAEVAPYADGEREWNANFPNYYCGGNATAWLFKEGLLPDALGTIEHYADEILNVAPRSSDGILTMVRGTNQQKIWIDVAFAVTPFLVFAGVAMGREDYLREAYLQTSKMVEIFRNTETGLLHQSRDFNGPGKLSEDHWSRGNGWGAYALAELALELPVGHPLKKHSVEMLLDLIDSALNYQDRNGLWHQEMSDLDSRGSYVETSGSGLLLYAVGRCLEAGIGKPEWRTAFTRGLSGLLDYITEDLDIFHTCRGCLCPGGGSKLEYRAMAPVRNDVHAFGPYVLAFGQASRIGIENTSELKIDE
tara:strand:+ start:684 stop:1787 length:1104 start_codon:yes stop_codon:yes gene_type:complete